MDLLGRLAARGTPRGQQPPGPRDGDRQIPVADAARTAAGIPVPRTIVVQERRASRRPGTSLGRDVRGEAAVRLAGPGHRAASRRPDRGRGRGGRAAGERSRLPPGVRAAPRLGSAGAGGRRADFAMRRVAPPGNGGRTSRRAAGRRPSGIAGELDVDLAVAPPRWSAPRIAGVDLLPTADGPVVSWRSTPSPAGGAWSGSVESTADDRRPIDGPGRAERAAAASARNYPLQAGQLANATRRHCLRFGQSPPCRPGRQSCPKRRQLLAERLQVLCLQALRAVA